MTKEKARTKKQPQEIDNTLKALFGKEATKILPRLVPEVQIITDQNIEMDRTTLRADLVYMTWLGNQKHIVNMELQTHGTIEVCLREGKREIEEELHMYYKYDYFLDDNPDVIKRVKKGKKEGLVEGRLQEARNSIMQLISKRFPVLEQLARLQVERISSLSKLNQLFTQLLDVTSEAEVRKLLNLPVE